MFPFFLFLNRCFSFLRDCCVFVFRSRFPTVFRQFSPTLFALSVVPCLSYLSSLISFLCQSFFLLLTSLLVICLLLFLVVFLFFFYVIVVLLSFVRPLYFVNSPRLRLLSLSFFVFLVLDVSFVFLNRSFPFLLHFLLFPLSVSHSISSILSDLDSFLNDFICLPVVLSFSYVSPFLSLSLSVVNSVTYVFAVLLSFARPLYFVNSIRLCLVCPSFFVFLALDVSVLCFPKSFLFFLASLQCVCPPLSVSQCISSILSDFVFSLCHSFLSYVSSLISLSF